MRCCVYMFYHILKSYRSQRKVVFRGISIYFHVHCQNKYIMIVCASPLATGSCFNPSLTVTLKETKTDFALCFLKNGGD